MKSRFTISKRSTHTIHEGTITASDLRKMFHIPAHAEIWVRVPGGGDWSSTDLLIAESPIQVKWEEVK